MKFRIFEFVNLFHLLLVLFISCHQISPHALHSSRIQFVAWVTQIVFAHEGQIAIVMRRASIAKCILRLFGIIERLHSRWLCRSAHLLLPLSELHDLCRCNTMNIWAISISLSRLLWHIVDHVFYLIEFFVNTLDGLYIGFQSTSMACWNAKIETRPHHAVIWRIELIFTCSSSTYGWQLVRQVHSHGTWPCRFPGVIQVLSISSFFFSARRWSLFWSLLPLFSDAESPVLRCAHLTSHTSSSFSFRLSRCRHWSTIIIWIIAVFDCFSMHFGHLFGLLFPFSFSCLICKHRNIWMSISYWESCDSKLAIRGLSLIVECLACNFNFIKLWGLLNLLSFCGFRLLAQAAVKDNA